jgi:pimeloyl-ACP methyl ester carboxylesterase
MKFNFNKKFATGGNELFFKVIGRRLSAFILLAVFAFGINLEAAPQVTEGSIDISESRAVAYKYIEAQDGQPTVVMLNGLIYPLKNWEEYITALAEKGYGVLLVAYSTQPESLRLTQGIPYYSRIKSSISGLSQTGLEISDLATDVMSVVDHFNLQRFHLQTLSFGSIIGSYIANNYGDRIESVTMVSPAVMPSHRYTPYGESRHNFYIWQNQININPFYVPDYYYDLELYQTMRMLLQSQYKTFDLKGTNFEYFFNGVYQMARSTKYFDLKDETSQPWPQTNIILASDEDPTLKRDQFNFWNEKFKAAPQSRLIEIMDVPHAIPGSNPLSLAEVSLAVLGNSIGPGQHQFFSETNTWYDQVSEANAADRTCKTYLRPKTTTGFTFGTF